jgi:deoxycytidine triphosphate deaminase
VTVTSLTSRHTNPTFADAIFFNVRLLYAVEPDSYATLKKLLVIMRAFRIDAETVGQYVGHDTIIRYFSVIHAEFFSIAGRCPVGVLKAIH